MRVDLFKTCYSCLPLLIEIFHLHQELTKKKNAPDLLTCFLKPCLPSTPMKIFGWWMHHEITICHEFFFLFPFIEISAFIKNQSEQRMHQIFICLLNYSYPSYFLCRSSVNECIIRQLFATIFDDSANAWDDLQTCGLHDRKLASFIVITLHTKPTVERALVLVCLSPF